MIHRQSKSFGTVCRPVRRWLLTACLALLPVLVFTCGHLMAVEEKTEPKKNEAKVAEPEKKAGKKETIKKPLTPAEKAKMKAEAKVKALAKKLNLRLGKLKPVDSRLTSREDYYITCTAQLNLTTREVDICFRVRQGQQQVADFLADYVLNPPETTLHKWHVIARFSEPEAAEAAVQATRQQYDQMVAYRSQLEKMYQAKKSRRC